MTENEISNVVIGCAIKVHRRLGPGLLESVYQKCLYYELLKTGLTVVQQKAIPVIYDEIVIDKGFRADMIVEGIVILEFEIFRTNV